MIPPVKPAPLRRSSLDLARFFAAFGVVVAHVQAAPRDWVGHLSLALFLILTAVLAIASFQKSGSYSMRARFWRLMLPWLFWCAFYWLVDFDVSDRARLLVWPQNPWTVFAGPSIHLWFLPFVMVAGLVVQPLGRFVTSQGRLLGALAVTVAIGLPAFWAHLSAGLPPPIEQWLFAIPVYLFGLLFGIALPMGRAAWVVTALALLTAMTLLVVQPAPWIPLSLVALVVFWALWNLPLSGPIPQVLGRDAFGIYLMHPFFLLVIYKFLGPDLGWLANALLAFSLSWAASMAMRRIPYLDRLI